MGLTKDDLLSRVRDDVGPGADEAEAHYLHEGPNKHEQDAHYQIGTSIVEMNVRLLESWLEHTRPVLIDAWEILSKADRREIWEASGFHFGMMAYEPHDADFWWKHEGD